jgi:threonyl-tRNA synthetase
MLIVGDKEVAARTLSVRQLDGTETKDVPWEEFVGRLQAEGQMPRLGKK